MKIENDLSTQVWNEKFNAYKNLKDTAYQVLRLIKKVKL